MDNEETCITCRFSRSIGNDNAVACHRYPPTITKAEGPTVTIHFPFVPILAWCGEYKRKPHK